VATALKRPAASRAVLMVLMSSRRKTTAAFLLFPALPAGEMMPLSTALRMRPTEQPISRESSLALMNFVVVFTPPSRVSNLIVVQRLRGLPGAAGLAFLGREFSPRLALSLGKSGSGLLALLSESSKCEFIPNPMRVVVEQLLARSCSFGQCGQSLGATIQKEVQPQDSKPHNLRFDSALKRHNLRDKAF